MRAIRFLVLFAPLISLCLAADQPAGQSEPGLVLEDGTPVKLKLTRALSSADAKPEQEISFEAVDDIEVGGVTVLRRGASAIGMVTEAEAKKRMGRAGKLNFTIKSVTLADGEKAPVRAVNDTSGESKVKGMSALMISGVPMAAAPFLLLIKGGDSSIPKGTEITAFIDGDLHLERSKFDDEGSLLTESKQAAGDVR